jgi:uncharacterized glyoxalase superfamily protein PhnB
MTAAPTVWPSLSYRDAPAGIAFLTDAFGFVANGVHRDDDDPNIVHHAQLDWPPGGGVMLGSSPRPENMTDPTGRGSTYCVVRSVAEVDPLFERATAAGATVVRPPADQDYGGRNFVVKDPEGNQWSFGDYPGE